MATRRIRHTSWLLDARRSSLGRASSRWFETRRRDWAAHSLFPWATGARAFLGTLVSIVFGCRSSSDANTQQN
ncbi:hypothetical protein BDZ89DRAFT_1063866 [Hymenopellis radicata]|nr:hypothetical protein BDZ89DRAFT_1063866 [Hymenopellis radicata]